MSCCLCSSRLKITSFFGRYSLNMTSTNSFPNEPVPPVTRTTCSDQFIKRASRKLSPSQFLRVFWPREYHLEGRRSGLEAVTASISESPRLGRAGRIERERGGRKFCL